MKGLVPIKIELSSIKNHLGDFTKPSFGGTAKLGFACFWGPKSFTFVVCHHNPSARLRSAGTAVVDCY